MALEPSFEEQELLADTLRRAASEMTRRELLAEVLVGVLFVAAVIGVWWLRPPDTFATATAVGCMAVLALASRVKFDTPFGYTVATQLAFVPLLFAAPIALVPLAVVLALAAARLPDVVVGRIGLRTLLRTPSNAWFAIGPVVVFALANVEPRDAGPALLIAALAAQFLGDFAASAVYFGIARGARIRSQLRETWVYGIDAALSGVGLVVAKELHSAPAAVIAVVPLLGLMGMFAHERRRRLKSLLELNDTYRGTALLLGDVIAADDGYTGEHTQGVVGLTLSVADQLGLDAEHGATLSLGRCCTMSARSRSPRRSSTSPASSIQASGGSSRCTRWKVRRCSAASADSCSRSARSCAPTTSDGTAGVTPIGSPGIRSRSRLASSPAVTPGMRCEPIAPTGPPSRTKRR
jgi:hypothetical protein